MAKHTPGPWGAAPPDRHEPYWIVHAAAGVGGVIAEVCSCPRPEAERNPSEVEANARLIAEAPALAASLEEAEARIAFLERRAAWHDHILETYAISGMGEELKALLDRAWDDMNAAGKCRECDGTGIAPSNPIMGSGLECSGCDGHGEVEPG